MERTFAANTFNEHIRFASLFFCALPPFHLQFIWEAAFECCASDMRVCAAFANNRSVRRRENTNKCQLIFSIFFSLQETDSRTIHQSLSFPITSIISWHQYVMFGSQMVPSFEFVDRKYIEEKRWKREREKNVFGAGWWCRRLQKILISCRKIHVTCRRVARYYCQLINAIAIGSSSLFWARCDAGGGKETGNIMHSGNQRREKLSNENS